MQDMASAAVDRVAARKDDWVAVDPARRARLLRRCIDGVVEVADAWVEEACRHRRIDPRSALAGEEWVVGPMTTVRNLRELAESLEQGGCPRPVAIGRSIDGNLVARVFPRTSLDGLLLHRMTAEVWIEAGRPPSQGRVYRERALGRVHPGRVALVLGAGNVSSIGPLDAAYKLFAEDQVVVLKTNPVNAYLAPFFRRAFAPLIDAGFLEIVTGGVEVGAALCSHPGVDTLHLTGSERTYDAIVWGADADEQRRRKAAATPLLDRPFTAELGCVTPVLVVPGTWSERELDFQARHVAAMVTHNASFNCTAGKVLLTAGGWPQRERFIERVRQALAATPPRYAYYPGAHERYAAFLERYPRAVAVGEAGAGVVPWTFVPGVPPGDDEYALNHEAFCGVLADVVVEAADAPSFLAEAVSVANRRIRGTLSCVVLVDARTAERYAVDLERAIADLRYGTVAVNAWSGVGFALGVTTWGAYPGHGPAAIGSGVGVVHNSYLFDHPLKSVIRAPFVLWPKPVWFSDHRALNVLGRRMTRFESGPTAAGLVGVVWAGMRG